MNGQVEAGKSYAVGSWSLFIVTVGQPRHPCGAHIVECLFKQLFIDHRQLIDLLRYHSESQLSIVVIFGENLSLFKLEIIHLRLATVGFAHSSTIISILLSMGFSQEVWYFVGC